MNEQVRRIWECRNEQRAKKRKSKQGREANELRLGGVAATFATKIKFIFLSSMFLNKIGWRKGAIFLVMLTFGLLSNKTPPSSYR